jgi:hypothetical protein
VTKESVWTTGENGCQAVAMKGEAGMSHRVNAWMKPMQAAGIDGAVDRAPRITERPRQLAD